MPGFISLDFAHGTILAGTGALQCKSGVIGGSAGVAGDTRLFGVIILKNAGPATLTIAGLADNTGTAQNVILTGSTTVDTEYIFPWPLRNEFAAFVFTPSVTLTSVVFLREYVGP